MMKQRFIYYFLPMLAVLGMLASCSKEEMGVEQGDSPNAQSGEIRFEIGFAPQNGAMQTDAQTRVTTDTKFNSTWEEGDEIGIFAAPHGTELANSGNFIHNVKLTYTNGEWTGPAYWPTLASGISKLDFYAYYPYNANAANPMSIAFNVHTDQSAATDNKSNYNLSDLLMAKNDNSGSGFGKDETVQLSFKHALAMVQVDVSQSMIGNYDSKALTVRLNGCPKFSELNLSTQYARQPVYNTSDITRIIMYPCPKDDATGIFAYRALVPVQEIDTGTVLFSFEYDGGTLLRSKPLGQPLSLVAGRVAKFDMTFPFVVANVSADVRLASLFTAEELDQITHLKVMGEMKSEDFDTIRDKMTNITNLDLSGAKANSIPIGGLEGKINLQKFTFPSNISTIETNAFNGCSGLTGPLIIPDGVSFIDLRAFQNCSGFTSLTIPASIRWGMIADTAFGGCTGLTSITCRIQDPAGGVYGANIFEGVSKEIPLYVPKGTQELYKNTSPWSDFNDIRPIL